MKVLVAYQTQSGNTKRVAEAIYGEIQADKDIKEIKDLEGLEGYDLYFVGFPVQGYGPANVAKVFLEEHAAGKDIALFITHASPEDREPLREWLDRCKEAAAGANIVGMFNCQGELAKDVADFMLNSGDAQLAAWAEDRPDTIGQPDATRLERARAFAREIMQKYAG
jgi:flavodoxin